MLAHACTGDPERLASLFYASTQDTQRTFGLIPLILDPRGSTTPLDSGNGFPQRTYVFPSAVVPVPEDSLGEPEGRLSEEERNALRGLLRTAIGCGTGTMWSARTSWEAQGPVYHAGIRAHSIRGRLVEFAPELRQQLRGETRDLDIGFGIVVSRHDVSAHPEAFQTIVPVIGDFEPTDHDELVATGGSWIDTVESGAERAVILIPETFYVHPSALRRTAYERVIAPELMVEIEEALVSRWARDVCAAG